VVHTLAHAVGALNAAERAGRPVTLLSARDAGFYAGPGWFKALLAEARAAVPGAVCHSLLDCGDRPGATLAAIRSGIEGVVFGGRADIARRLAEIGAQHGVRLVTERPHGDLDLGEDFFATAEASERRCRDFLSLDDA
jgi:delta 1-pyrroline-5-carboxylate dehydrogenase